MGFFTKIIEILVFASLGLGLVKSYLTINKVWIRKHDKVVSESVSIMAQILSLVTVLPFLIKYILIDHSIADSIKALTGLLMTVVFFLIGIGFWVKGPRIGIWAMLKKALHLEKKEAGELVKAFIKPKGADKIIRILHQVAMIDRDLDENEKKFIQEFADAWRIKYVITAPVAGEKTEDMDFIKLRENVEDYLSIAPANDQVTHLRDVLNALVKADKKVSKEEDFIISEINGLLDNYIEGEGGGTVYEVLIAPQSQEQEEAIRGLLPNATKIDRAGGTVFVVGIYYSDSYARMMCKKYRALHFFATVEIVQNTKAA